MNVEGLQMAMGVAVSELSYGCLQDHLLRSQYQRRGWDMTKLAILEMKVILADGISFVTETGVIYMKFGH